MDVKQRINDEQSTLWNGLAGRGWVQAQEPLDQTLKPFEDLLVLEVSSADCGGRVLDVGCGAGAITLALAQQLGPQGHCTGIDISEVMIQRARARAERNPTTVNFIRGDAQTHAFEPGSFDLIVSRFGVMFFEDFVAAFENLRHAAKAGGELRLIVWRSASENPFMTTAERAAAALLPNLPARRTDGPGQFALADERVARKILEQSGWAEIGFRPIDAACAFAEKELVPYFSTLGPVGRILGEMDDSTRAAVIKTVRAAFEPCVHGAEVRFTAACWMIRGRA
ncbi:MAG TPA: methyltransferase domain-containing protein [Bryobacteraceae bacterium]|nr:methyltransferase domain-containing protein [Bryobacteraceae bacterium]